MTLPKQFSMQTTKLTAAAVLFVALSASGTSPKLINPPIEDNNCYTNTISTNCYPGSVTLVNTSTTTNFCLGSAVELSADMLIRPARLL